MTNVARKKPRSFDHAKVVVAEGRERSAEDFLLNPDHYSDSDGKSSFDAKSVRREGSPDFA